MSRWFRHYAGMMRDDKLVRVAIRTQQPIERVVWVWGAILESASEIDDEGRYDFDAAEAAYFLRTDQADIDNIEAGLAAAGHVDSGCVVKWGNRQFKSDKSAARQADYRERKRAENSGNHDNETSRDCDVTSLSRHGDAPETETELETYISEPKGSSPRPWVCPVGVSRETWADFLTNRKRKKLVNTASTWKTFQDDLARISLQTGIPPPKLIEQCTGKGWGGIYDPNKDARNERPDTNPLQSAVERIIRHG